MSNFDQQVYRNLKGQELEKKGLPEEAILLYEINVSEGFEGSFPYRRLAVLYRKKGFLKEEIRVLEKAVNIFQQVAIGQRSDGLSKLQEFETRLRKIKMKNAT